MAQIVQFSRHRRRGERYRPRSSRQRKFWRTSSKLNVAAWSVIIAVLVYVFPAEHAGPGDGQHLINVCSAVDAQICVIDGDTIRLHGQSIRMADYNTPEITNPKCGTEARLGQEARRRLIDILNQGDITIVSAGDRDEDDFGRKLRVVKMSGQSVGDVLVREGLAHPWEGVKADWCS